MRGGADRCDADTLRPYDLAVAPRASSEDS
jgi:hypothetical protein